MRKGATLETLLRQHWDDRCIVFTKSVEEVYALSRRFLIPGITYETPAKRERRSWTGSASAATGPSSPRTS
jgi:superfamily II DNA or RNA helicase